MRAPRPLYLRILRTRRLSTATMLYMGRTSHAGSRPPLRRDALWMSKLHVNRLAGAGVTLLADSTATRSGGLSVRCRGGHCCPLAKRHRRAACARLRSQASGQLHDNGHGQRGPADHYPGMSSGELPAAPPGSVGLRIGAGSFARVRGRSFTVVAASQGQLFAALIQRRAGLLTPH